MKIRVTAKDIGEGYRHISFCPIALALKKKFKTKTVEVGLVNIIINGEKIITPERACIFIEEFDNFKSVKPFTFELPIKAKRRK